MHSPPPQRSKLSWPTAAHGDTPSVRGHLAATLSLVMVRSLLLLAWRCITTCVATAAALLLSTHGPRPAGLRRTPSEVLRLSHLDAAPSTTEIVFVGDASCGKSELLCEALRHRPVGFAAADEAPGLEAQRVGVIVCSAVQADGFESLLPYVKRWRLALRRDFGGRVPVVLVCTKADLTPMRLPLIQALEEQGVACLTVSAKVGTNVRHLWQLFARGLPPALLSTAARRHGLLLRLQAVGRGCGPRARRARCLRAVRSIQAEARGRLSRRRASLAAERTRRLRRRAVGAAGASACAVCAAAAAALQQQQQQQQPMLLDARSAVSAHCSSLLTPELLDLAYGALLVAAVAAAVFVQKVGLPMLFQLRHRGVARYRSLRCRERLRLRSACAGCAHRLRRVRALVPWPGAHPSPARPPPLQLSDAPRPSAAPLGAAAVEACAEMMEAFEKRAESPASPGRRAPRSRSASGRLPTLCERGDGFGPLALRRVLTFP